MAGVRNRGNRRAAIFVWRWINVAVNTTWMDWKSGDGVFTGSTLDLAVDGGEVVEAPKHVSPCIEMTQ